MNKKQTTLKLKKAAQALNKAGDVCKQYSFASMAQDLYSMAERRKRAAELIQDGKTVNEAMYYYGIYKI